MYAAPTAAQEMMQKTSTCDNAQRAQASTFLNPGSPLAPRVCILPSTHYSYSLLTCNLPPRASPIPRLRLSHIHPLRPHASQTLRLSVYQTPRPPKKNAPRSNFFILTLYLKRHPSQQTSRKRPIDALKTNLLWTSHMRLTSFPYIHPPLYLTLIKKK